jgi:hypothetical protein
MKRKVVSIDFAKNVFPVCGLDQHNKPRFNKSFTGKNLLDTTIQLDCDSVVMEACYCTEATHYMGVHCQDELKQRIDSLKPNSLILVQAQEIFSRYTIQK